MAERDFLNVNDNIDFPFLQGFDRRLAPTVPFPRLGLVDAGFLLGLDSGFVAGQHSVFLYRVVKQTSILTFYFNSNAPGLAGSHWEFVFDLNAGFGCTLYANAMGDPAGVNGGVGFVTVGNLGGWTAVANNTYNLTTRAPLEPALLQSLINTYVRKIGVANVGRPCPSHCCEEAYILDPQVYVNADNIVGNVRLLEGYNCQILVSQLSNTIEIKATLGGGAGQNCVDLRVDSGGVHADNGSLCEKCQDYISSINGVPTVDGAFRLYGEKGLAVLGNPETNTLDVSLNTHQVASCGGA